MRCALIFFILASFGIAQPQRTLGDVTASDKAGNTFTVTTASGGPVTVSFDATTVFLRVPPGETSLSNATKIASDDVQVGDRVLATGTSPAQRIIVMTKSDLEQKQAKERSEWQSRGASGAVAAIDPAAGQLTLKKRAFGSESTVVVETTGKTEYRRYAPDSVKFSDAKPSSLAEVRMGDQVRVLGEQPLENGKITAKVIVSGTFRNVAGTVLSVDAANGEVRLKDLETKQPLAVKVGAGATLRRLPPMMAQGMAARMNAGTSGAAAATPPAGGAAPGQQRGFGGPPGAGGRGGDMQAMLERMPALQLSELKPGDALIVNSTAGAETGKVTAITMLAGVEPLLTAPTPQGDRRLNGPWNMGDINIMP